MCSSKQIKELAECNAVYEFEKTVIDFDWSDAE